MSRLLASIAITIALLAAPVVVAQEAKAPAKAAKTAAAPKAGKDQKVCRYRFPDGEQRTWVCQKAEPCCAWDAIKYVKCGSTTFNCL